jgi:hypothetical protein
VINLLYIRDAREPCFDHTSSKNETQRDQSFRPSQTLDLLPELALQCVQVDPEDGAARCLKLAGPAVAIELEETLETVLAQQELGKRAADVVDPGVDAEVPGVAGQLAQVGAAAAGALAPPGPGPAGRRGPRGSSPAALVP